MEIINIKCANCGKEIYVQEDHIREKMFCTLGCLSSKPEAISSKATIFS